MPGPVGLLLVDDHQVVLEGLGSMLASQSHRVKILGATTDPEEALALIGELEPDVVLLDVRLRGASGLDLCQQLIDTRPGTKVVFFTVYDDEQYLFQALRVGASGFLLKTTTAPELAGHLERVMEGEVAIDPVLAGRVAMTAARFQSGEFWPGARLGLTQRESEVLELMVRGLSNRAIGQKLYIGEETVKTHARGIYRKLEVPDRAQAIATALREGIFH
ncbi:MAG TPA: response regulator transcription factor [Acidimicrobiales bacterium]|nr:response regulator transcription factor [Acidimicrobiales bacterium]